MDPTYLFAPIVKADKDPATGFLHVTGKMTGTDLDLDEQRCDADWLKGAVPKWFKSGANVREMHTANAVGVGVHLEQDGDDWLLRTLVVDPIAIAKVENKVLTGYSIGIRGPRIAASDLAPKGMIVGGDIIETSLVDRPALPTAKFLLAKMAGADLIPAAEWTAKAAADGQEEDVPAGDPVEGDPAELDGNTDPPEDEEVPLLTAAHDALAALLVGEAAELEAGVGGTGPIRILLGMLEDLSWFECLDAMDDDVALAAAVKAIKTIPEEDPVPVKLDDIDKALEAATPEERSAFLAKFAAPDPTAPPAGTGTVLTKADLESALEPVTTKLDKVASPEDLEAFKAEVSERLAKVEGMAAPSGPVRAVVSALEAADRAKVDAAAQATELRTKAATVTDPALREGYLAQARALESSAV